MNGITEYLLSITAAGVLCAAIKHMLDHKSSSGKIIQAVSGIFMAITVFSPILHFRIDHIEDYFQNVQYSAEDVTKEGVAMACNTMADIIKQQSESYILDKAMSIGANIDLKIKMSNTNPPVPKEVILSGSVSPYDKKIITMFISDNFGISEENQKWI